MKKLYILALMLVGLVGYSQYSTPRKLYTITIKDSYKGSSIKAYRVMRNYRKTQTSYVPIDVPATYESLEPLPIYHSNESNDSSPYHVCDDGRVYIWATTERGVTYKKYLL